jgi:hypothetical protein
MVDGLTGEGGSEAIDFVHSDTNLSGRRAGEPGCKTILQDPIIDRA